MGLANASAEQPLAVMVYEEQAKDRHLLVVVSPDGVHFHNASSSPYIPGLPSYFADTEAALLELGPDVRPGNATADGEGGGCFAAYGRLDVFPGAECSSGGERTFRRAQAGYAVTPNGSCSSAVALGPYHDVRQSLDIERGVDPAACLDVYNTAPQLVPGAVLAMPSMFRHIGDSGIKPQFYNDGVMDARLLVSRDGVSFRAVSRRAFLPRGMGYRDPESGWFNVSGSDRDAGFVFVTVGGLMDDAVTGTPGGVTSEPSPYQWLFYWGSQTTHAEGGVYLAGTYPGAFHGILRARLRREGFVALTTTSDRVVGSARSVVLQVPSPEEVCVAGTARDFGLRLNAHAPGGGNVTVALLDAAGQEYPGFGHGDAVPLLGNYVRGVAGWAGGDSFTSLQGKAMQLELRVANADVFAWELVCQ